MEKIKKPVPGIKDLIPEDKDNIGKSVKKADDLFQTSQELIDKYRQIILENEKVILALTFIIGMSLAWLFSACTPVFVLMLSHKILIGVVVFFGCLLLISTNTIPLAYVAMIIVCLILGLGFGEIALAWDSNTYRVVTNGVCENPINAKDFLVYILGMITGMLFIGKRYKLF